MSVNNSLFCDPRLQVRHRRAEEARSSRRSRAGKKLGCFGLTEPMSGSDAQTMVTSAEKTSGGWVLNGAKNWITNGPHADYIIVFAVTDRSGPKVQAHRVPRRAAARPATRRTPPTTSSASTPRTRARSSSRTARCPTAHVVGDVGRRLQGRDGHARRRAHRHRVRRRSASRAPRSRRASPTRRSARASASPIAKHQAIQFMLADMATRDRRRAPAHAGAPRR